jgi:hypothetical protein
MDSVWELREAKEDESNNPTRQPEARPLRPDGEPVQTLQLRLLANLSGDWGDMGDGGRSRKDQIEFICDADYIRMYGERAGRKTEAVPWTQFYDETVSPMIRANYGTKPFVRMMKKVFQHSRYE